MAGRSNLQQATPITFGYKCAVLLAGFQRHLERLEQMRPRVLVGEFGGATGTLASLGDEGLRVQAALMAELGLGQPDIAWHTMRDRVAEVGCFLGLVCGTLGKVSMDVKLMMQTEVEEVFEPFAEGRGSSSTMPQKRNPISSNYHPCLCRDGAAERGGTARCDGRRSRAQHRAVGDRMDCRARDLPALGGRPGAGAVPGRRLAGRSGADARQSRSDEGFGRVGGGDDGPRPGAWPPARARSRL